MRRLKNFLSSYWTIGVLWVIAALFVVIFKAHCDPARLNNFLIYRQTFWHAVEGLNLYAYYPEEYFDHNLYGPLFAIFMAPFALLPKIAGAILWELFLVAGIFLTILKFPYGKQQKILMMWYISNDIFSALLMTQFNMVIAFLVPAAYLAIRKDRPGWAAFFILFGGFTKLYGLVDLSLFFFIKRKWKFLMWCAIWSGIFFCLPMLISSPGYIVDQYKEWFICLTAKNDLNTVNASVIDLTFHQNISFLGMTHRITGLEFPDLWILLPALLLFCLPYLRVSQWKFDGYQWGYVALSLMSLILFSTGSETSGYIMALLGVAIWYWSAPWKRNSWDLFLLLFALVLGSFGHSNLMPKYLRQEWIRPYVLKALPIMLVWLQQIFELLTRHYDSNNPEPTDSQQTASITNQY